MRRLYTLVVTDDRACMKLMA